MYIRRCSVIMQNMHSSEIKTSFAHTCCPWGNVSWNCMPRQNIMCPTILEGICSISRQETSTQYCKMYVWYLNATVPLPILHCLASFELYGAKMFFKNCSPYSFFWVLPLQHNPGKLGHMRSKYIEAMLYTEWGWALYGWIVKQHS